MADNPQKKCHSTLLTISHHWRVLSRIKSLFSLLAANYSLAVAGLIFIKTENFYIFTFYIYKRALITSHAFCIYKRGAFITSHAEHFNTFMKAQNECLGRKLHPCAKHSYQTSFNSVKYDHVTPILGTMRWLPVKYHSEYRWPSSKDFMAWERVTIQESLEVIHKKAGYIPWNPIRHAP